MRHAPPVPPAGMTLVRLTYGEDTAYMAWCGTDAAAQILIHPGWEGEQWEPTGYQTADACHRLGTAARLAASRVWEGGGDGVGLDVEELD